MKECKKKAGCREPKRETKVNRGQGQIDCIREKNVLIRAQEEENQTKLIKLGEKWKLAIKGHSKAFSWD